MEKKIASITLREKAKPSADGKTTTTQTSSDKTTKAIEEMSKKFASTMEKYASQTRSNPFKDNAPDEFDKMAAKMSADASKHTQVVTGTGGKEGGGAKAAEGGLKGLMGLIAGISAIATVMSAGITAILGAVMDFPIVVGIMKMLKLIMMALLMPLIPILKPVLIGLGWLVKNLMTLLTPKTGAEGVGSVTGGVLGAIVGAIVGGPWGALLGAWLGSMIGVVVAKIVEWLGKIDWAKIGQAIWDFLAKAVKILGNIGQWIWDNIFVKGFKFLAEIGSMIWDLIKAKWKWDLMVATKIWEMIKNIWKWDLIIGEKIWEVLKSTWSWGLSIADKIWEMIKTSWNWSLDIGKKLGDWIGNLFSGSNNNSRNNEPSWLDKVGSFLGLNDGIVQNGKVITTHPDDYIIATKNPESLGSGSSKKGNNDFTINLTINNPSIRNDADIKALIREIETNLITNMRRYNSYV